MPSDNETLGVTSGDKRVGIRIFLQSVLKTGQIELIQKIWSGDGLLGDKVQWLIARTQDGILSDCAGGDDRKLALIDVATENSKSFGTVIGEGVHKFVGCLHIGIVGEASDGGNGVMISAMCRGTNGWCDGMGEGGEEEEQEEDGGEKSEH